ncbi:TIGR04255 family protein [bacterium]|nr:TIGR04255 family protein [bacterium]
MSRKELKNKPLVEAIFEIRWKLQGNPGSLRDAHYKFLLGRLFDRMKDEYPEHEQLPAANIPEEMAGHIIQHRFRVDKDSWPLVQIGPGIFTVNSTVDYKWDDFRPRVIKAVEKLYDAHPKQDELEITNIILRYVDAVEFDYTSNNSFDFIKDKLKLNLSLPENLFKDTKVEKNPCGFTWQNAFKCEQPKGVVNLRFAAGKKKDAPAIIWDTTVESAGGDLPVMPDDFEKWFSEAHEITDDWFFKMIEGELERRFSGE